MKSVENFLLELPQPLIIVGGSPLIFEQTEDDRMYGGRGHYNCFPKEQLPDFAISINGLCPGAYAAAVNCSRKDARRVRGWSYVMRPNPQPDVDNNGFMVPAFQYKNRFDLEGKQPTTCLMLLQICEVLKLRVELFGICGWASKWHNGDLEMHFIKTRMPLVTVHDPRQKW